MEELMPLLVKKTKQSAQKKITTEALVVQILENAKLVRGKKRIACSIALRIAAESKVSPKRISRLCKEEGVKIRSCMLDCFE